MPRRRFSQGVEKREADLRRIGNAEPGWILGEPYPDICLADPLPCGLDSLLGRFRSRDKHHLVTLEYADHELVGRVHLGDELLNHGDLEPRICALLNEVDVDLLKGPITC